VYGKIPLHNLVLIDIIAIIFLLRKISGCISSTEAGEIHNPFFCILKLL
jgi:hypothetical protein